ncbi:fructose-1,6-bisphosphate aldolase [Coccomyxa subellipsoidea C-169]|uniref:Fructose-bisphosphate aldolase n=1 Tax=Coccomyxa subellipsoidea (strain C-169) TaxID=574566 RepID=I0YSE8_COCSC|nr:fructose-1,6-bisphosphate aldolase [Coccomyxa subellipsoidea C-169]EIE21317.1 fructose-1,6-bisphosphate aldolase [Coccomyxa subellipsoidea C-169]|eukprot:XP_005645861.1 fructose-1,6-bisphosphate aldolase [Coccomyxa subellipsoidea C-169]
MFSGQPKLLQHRNPAAAQPRSSSTRLSFVTRASYNAGATNPFRDELIATAKYISQRGKGILASDESNATTGKRLATVGVDNTESNRRDWREVLYTADGLGNYISGCIMFEETLYQSSAGGVPFVKILKDAGIVPGIKVDTGLQVLPGTDGETTTQGLDNLPARVQEYYKQGARFAKWRAVIKIGTPTTPSSMAVLENAHGLARYAQICQENGLVPIVEPEVTLGPGDYTIEENAYWSEHAYSHVFRLLNEYNVLLEGILLKPNMCLPGLDVPTPPPSEVAKYTVRTMLRSIPPAVPGIHFLSGGMSEEESTLNLQALQEECPNSPWSLTFSYGRALQSTTLKTWAGHPENKHKAQDILVKLAKANSEAQLGQYKGPHPVPGGQRILQALRLGGSGT